MATHKFNKFISLNIPPHNAHHIGVYKNGSKVGNVGLGSFKKNKGTKLYSFGVLSDVHNKSSQDTESFADLKNAIQYFTDVENVEFTVICGDLTQTYSSEDSELTMYAQNIGEVVGHAPVYPTTGNHDCPSSGDVDIARFKTKTGTTDLYTSDATYSYEITKTHGDTVDHFLFLGMRRWNFSAAYLDADITWLGNKLKAYQNDRCFIITHLFFPDAAGNFKSYYPSYNWLSGAQLEALKTLRATYPRVIWFSGHSHWKWYLQNLESKANVWPVEAERQSAVTVHISSCAKPIDSDDANPSASGDRDEVIGNKESEGAVVDVYEDYIELRGIEFKKSSDTEYTNSHIPIAQYRIPTNPYDGYEVPVDEDPSEPESADLKRMTLDFAQEHTSKNALTKCASMAELNSVTSGAAVYVDSATHDMTVKICAVKTGFFIADGGSYTAISGVEGKLVGTDIAEGSVVTIYHDGIEWISTEPTAAQKAKIGFYGGGYAVGQSSTSYTLESGVTVDTTKACMQLQTSSSFSGTVPAVFTIKNFRYYTNGAKEEESGSGSGSSTDTPSQPSTDGYTYVTQAMCHDNTAKTAGCTYQVDDATHDVRVTFTANSQGFFINNGGTVGAGKVTGGDIAGATYADIAYDEWVWESGEPTAAAKNKVGIYATNTGYNSANGVRVTYLISGGIEINCSSSFTSNGGVLPITFVIKNLRYKLNK